jgi:tyrosyl-tRNA synthetase
MGIEYIDSLLVFLYFYTQRECMDIEAKINLVKKGTTAEIVTLENLRELFESNDKPRHYIGFEISGKVHLGTGLITALKIKDFIEAGIKPTIFLADYHGWINGKMGGDLDKIQRVAKGYFKEAFVSLGLTEDKVDYIMGSDLYEEMGGSYWADVMRITNNTTKERMLRCTTAMGRSERDKALATSVMLYPAMQVADMWALDIDIAHAGMDQRKVHMLGRELADKLKRKKPVAVHGVLLDGLQGSGRMDEIRVQQQVKKTQIAPGIVKSEERTTVSRSPAQIDADEEMIAKKMSKSNPNSCIFIHDTVKEINEKIKKAHCPIKVAVGNPIIQYARYLVLRDKPLQIHRPEKFGGDVSYASYPELETAYLKGELHPMDLKTAVARELIEMLTPSREYFEKHPELIEQVER